LGQADSWPPNLAVEELNLQVSGQNLNFDLRSLPKNCVRTLKFLRVAAPHVHSLVKILGGSVVELFIFNCDVQAELNVLALLEACPKLQQLHLHSVKRNSLDINALGNLTAAHFKNLTL